MVALANFEGVDVPTVARWQSYDCKYGNRYQASSTCIMRAYQISPHDRALSKPNFQNLNACSRSLALALNPILSNTRASIIHNLCRPRSTTPMIS